MKFIVGILEKKSIYKVLVDIAKADNIVTDEEASYIFQLQKTLNISLSEINNALKMDFDECLNILRGISAINKKLVSKMILELINIDGKIDLKEVELFSEICKMTDIPLPEDIKGFVS